MKTRQYGFTCLSCGMLLVIAALCVLYAAQSYHSDAELLGGIVGFICWSLVPSIGAILFALMAWRNRAGLQSAARHEELIRTLRETTGKFPAFKESR